MQCEIYLKFIIKTPEPRYLYTLWKHQKTRDFMMFCSVFIVNFEQMLPDFFLAFAKCYEEMWPQSPIVSTALL